MYLTIHTQIKTHPYDSRFNVTGTLQWLFIDFCYCCFVLHHVVVEKTNHSLKRHQWAKDKKKERKHDIFETSVYLHIWTHFKWNVPLSRNVVSTHFHWLETVMKFESYLTSFPCCQWNSIFFCTSLFQISCQLCWCRWTACSTGIGTELVLLGRFDFVRETACSGSVELLNSKYVTLLDDFCLFT